MFAKPDQKLNSLDFKTFIMQLIYDSNIIYKKFFLMTYILVDFDYVIGSEKVPKFRPSYRIHVRHVYTLLVINTLLILK
jgi:hypothetical protein